MTTITTKFGIGDTVYWASTVIAQKQHPCPDCLGSREWKATSPAGAEYTFACPRCSERYMRNCDLSLKYSVHEPAVRKMTVGSVRTDSHEDKPNSYMCRETGVGSGAVYYENDLFATEAEAMRAAEAMAVSRTQQTDWMVKQYDHSLSICDYQLHSAEREANAIQREQWTSRYRDFQYKLDDCTTVEEFRLAIEAFRNTV